MTTTRMLEPRSSATAGYVWGKSDTVVKVKEPIEQEYAYFREGLVLFTYLHLAPIPVLTNNCSKRR